MLISASSAMWFLPFVLPICLYVAWSDMRAMRIPNHSVLALALVFLVIGLLALPLAAYPWRLAQLGVVLVLGMVLNATGLVGAGDAKFAAAAAPLIHVGDLRLVIVILASTILAAFLTHRIAKHSPIRKLVPEWESWHRGWDFPMGLALGGTLTIYLCLGALYGV